jgi:small subunit ribosomal protein S15
MLAKSIKAELTKTYGVKYGSSEKDSGCPAVQVAILTHRINELKEHFGKHIHDYHSNRGLLKMIGSRKSLLRYLQRKNEVNYKGLITDLGLRK